MPEPDSGRVSRVRRRAVLGTLLAGAGAALAGCSRSSVDGSVVENETPLSLSHEYAIQATGSGTRIAVDVTLTNDGSEPITPEGRVPRLTCTYLDDSGEELYQSGRELVEPLDIEETTTLQFTLGVDVEDVAAYELRSKWTDE